MAVLQKAAKDFNDTSAMMEVGDDAGELMCCVRDAVCALDCSIQSILCDDEITDKGPSIQTTFSQFQRYIDDLGLEDDDGDDTTKRNETMTTPALSPAVQKIIDEAVAAAVSKAGSDKDALIAKLNEDLSVAKMSDKHAAYYANLGSDDKKRFQGMTPDQRDQEMDKTKKRLEDDPVVKSLLADNETLRKRLEALEGDKELEIAKKDAAGMGIDLRVFPDAGKLLKGVRRGDKECIAKFEDVIKTLTSQKSALERTSKVFEEFGTTKVNPNGASANDELMAKAEELRKVDPKLSIAQAYEKVYLDPANRELKDRESVERMNKIHRAA
jgi:hypothetical protein